MEQTQTTPIRQRRSREQIRELLTLYSTSKLTVTDFCRQHHINPANFHKWKALYKNKAGDRKISGCFTALDVVPVGTVGLFAEVRGIRIYQPVTATLLKLLLA